MFEGLSNQFLKIFSKLSKRQNLTERNMADALSDIRRALLSADVAIDVVQGFIEEVKSECVGQQILKKLQPGQQVVKIVHDKLIAILGGDPAKLSLRRPLVVMMVGLQGSGKTTTSAKLALLLKNEGEKPALVACDIYRPAAIEQLQILGQQIGVPVFSYGKISVTEIAQQALKEARDKQATVVIFDTAGRLQSDRPMMEEIQKLKAYICPQEILLVTDSALGQESVQIAKTFHEMLQLTGIILTKLDGDAKGGAALSMKRSVQVPIKFSGIGEKVEDLEPFYPDRIVKRILGMGDIVSLVENVQKKMDFDAKEAANERAMKGDFNFNDFLFQIRNLKKIGSDGLSRWLPSGTLAKLQVEYADEMLRYEAIILSMTREERLHPHLLNSSYRRARLIKGAGLTLSKFNKFLKQFQEIKKMMQKLRKADPKQLKAIIERAGGTVPSSEELLKRELK